MPAPIVACERMQLVDHDGPDRSEEPAVIDPAGDQDDFERLGRRQEAVGWIGDDVPLLGLGRVAVPAGGPPTHQAEVALQPLLLVVQQGSDRADVEDAQPVPGFGQHPGEHGEERRLGLTARRRCQDDEVGPVEEGVDGQLLDGPQLSPAEGIDDVVLEGRVQSVECAHRSSSMSSTPVAWASRSVAVISSVLSVSR